MNIGNNLMQQPKIPAHDLPSADPREDAFRENLQTHVYDWIQAEIPSWKPDRNSCFQRTSQALTATIPGSSKMPAGLVFFKNVFDPCWSEKDLARLDAAAYPWILMILNPCERFNEFEARLREIASNLQTLLIWHPDTPSRTELETLRRLVFPDSGQGEGEPPGSRNRETIHQILANLYVARGQLTGISGKCSVSAELGGRSLCQFLSAQLDAISSREAMPASGNERHSQSADDENQALQWAELLVNRSDIHNSGAQYARDQLIEWWMNAVEGLSRRLPDFPEAFRTTRFWNEIKFVEAHAQALKPVFYNLRGGASSFQESMDLIGRHFAWDRGRMLKWRQALENLGGVALWLPTFLNSQEYVRNAFPLGSEGPDRLRAWLLQSMHNPLSFLEAKNRQEFDAKFVEFKKSYMDCYHSLHEDALHVMSGLRREESKIDPVSLRNLDLLSGLQYTDKSYLNRVKVLAKWIQRNQCTLPLRDILERYPRCFCNFNPSGNQQTAVSVSQINGIIEDGIEYFRNILRRCGYLIVEDLKSDPVDDDSLRQINSLLGDGPMIALKPETIKKLNRVILKNPSEFLTEMRKIQKISGASR